MSNLIAKSLALAVTGTVAVPTGIMGDMTIGEILSIVIDVVFFVGIGVTLIFVIIGGIRWATASGDVKQATAARDTVTNAIIGAIIIVAFRALIYMGLKFVGVDLTAVGIFS